MYLKSLTMKGFKSFASATTLQLEPGITCIVGPNGSGKSNVVDALAWVMGEQGAKSLRGGKMEDVIFAGTSGRPPLGRAEVVLTIDNSDGALPIEYAEVTIGRTMFRNGGSEYAINGNPCRLLDVQELLSDSGIGREMHVIVGQGQLDTILHATPEDRRGFIEEAAGVLKHRKRKEKALRKLESTDGNLTRLADLLSEIRRQLKPLGRQAEVARRAAVVQADVRDARARLLADDLATARSSLQQEIADESILLERKEEVEREIGAAREREAALEAALREDLPALSRAQETWFGLSGLRERIRGTQGLAAERVRNAADQSAEAEATGGRDPDELEAEAERVAAQEAGILAEVEGNRTRLEGAVTARQTAEQQFGDEERHVAGLQRAAADRREGMARLHGQVNGLRSRSAAAEEEIGRLATAREAALARAAEAQRDFTSLETRVAGLDQGEEGLDSEHEEASALLGDLEDQLASIREQATTADRERSSLAARKEALEMGLNRKDGAGALLAATDSVSGMLGSVAALLSVQSGYEAAVAAALGGAADAVAVRDVDAAIGAIDHLKTDDLGRAGILLGGAGVDDAAWPGLPEGAVYAMDVVECPDDLRPALSRLLFKIAVVEELVAAKELVDELPDVTAVTRDGDLLGAHFASGGSSSAPSLIEVQAAVDEATERAGPGDPHRRAARVRGADPGAAAARRGQPRRRRAGPAARVRRDPGRRGRGAGPVRLRSPGPPAARPSGWPGQIAAAEAAREQAGAGLAELEQRLSAAEDAPEEEPDTSARERLADGARAARQAEMDARLAAADRRGACPRPARPRRQPAAHRARPSARPGPGRSRGASGSCARAAPARRSSPPSAVVLARARGVGHRAAVARTRVEDGRARPRAGAAGGARDGCATLGPRPRRAGQLRPPRRDGPHPAAHAHRADRGARAGGARARRRRAGRRLRPRPGGPVHRRGGRGRGHTRAGAVRP